MRIIGLVSFWDESPTWLAASISSLGRFCDHVIVLDGRYALYPDKRLQSGTGEHYAAIDAARAVGMGITLHTAPATFPDEMSKRTKLFELAALESTPGEDWYFVLDADEVVVESFDKDGIHHYLSALDSSVTTVTAKLWEKADPHESPARTELSMKLPVDWRYECASPRFWRVHKNMRVVGYHYNYVGDDADGNPVELWGNDHVVQRDKTTWASLCAHVVLENRNRMRAKSRDKDRQQYYADRDLCGLETLKPLSELERVSV